MTRKGVLDEMRFLDHENVKRALSSESSGKIVIIFGRC